ncbi:hypothetical protein JHK86_018999 [Glycine max]|nr:hypothetical protein JHK86_018999 [Glycine max]
MSSRASLLPWHRFMGMAIFLLAVGTAETSLVEYFQFLQLFRSQEGLIVNSNGLLLFLFATGFFFLGDFCSCTRKHGDEKHENSNS